MHDVLLWARARAPFESVPLSRTVGRMSCTWERLRGWVGRTGKREGEVGVRERQERTIDLVPEHAIDLGVRPEPQPDDGNRRRALDPGQHIHRRGCKGRSRGDALVARGPTRIGKFDRCTPEASPPREGAAEIACGALAARS